MWDLSSPPGIKSAYPALEVWCCSDSVLTSFFFPERHKGTDEDFPGGPLVKNLPANAGDMGLIPGPGRFHMPQGS